MKLYELSQLPYKERYKFVTDLKESDLELPADVKIVNDIFDDTIAWFQKPTNQRDPDLISKLKDTKEELPPFFETIYEINEKHKIEKLPSDERQRIFDDYKVAWCLHYPDFKRISDIMEIFNTNEMLVQYKKSTLPSFIRYRAIEVFKKCLSYKVKLKKHKIDNLGYSYTPEPYCINTAKVKLFTDEYIKWGRKSYEIWYDVYYLKEDFFRNAGYDSLGWEFYIKHLNSLKAKADKVEKIYNETIEFLKSGIELVNKHDEAITLEYERNSFEMSLYERELEILQINEDEIATDEEYCYVYTLECELFVFYVGIAANPEERFEQHIRGAFSDEAHLFKSKFIQKYHKEVKQKIVFEGTRRECKKFEKNYIAEHNPLGNMTEGGEG